MALAETHDYDEVPEWTLGDRLRKAREHANLTQTQLAERLHTTGASVSRWEAGAQPRDLLDTIERWSKATSVPADWLLGLRTGSFATLVPFTPASLGQGSFDDLDWSARRPALTSVSD